MRKTLSTAAIIIRANTFLATSDDDQKGEREGVSGLLEALLHDADAYAGFEYLPAAKLVRHYDSETTPVPRVTIEDDTRRRYYTKNGLRIGS